MLECIGIYAMYKENRKRNERLYRNIANYTKSLKTL